MALGYLTLILSVKEAYGGQGAYVWRTSLQLWSLPKSLSAALLL